MSTLVRVTMYSRAAPDWSEISTRVQDWVQLYDHRLPDSPVARLNATGQVQAPPELLRVLGLGQLVAVATRGAFDQTILPLSQLWDFDNGGVLPEGAPLALALTLVDYQKLRIEADAAYLDLPGGVDLGAIAKGAIVDQLADYLESLGHTRFLVEAGGDLLVSGLKPGGQPWRIGLRHPRSTSRPLALLSLGADETRLAVVTSGDYERYFDEGGVRYHHLLDPRTGYPAADAVAVTVVAPSAALADALATGLFVRGPAGLADLQEFPDASGLVLFEEADGLLQARVSGGFPVDASQLRLD